MMHQFQHQSFGQLCGVEMVRFAEMVTKVACFFAEPPCLFIRTFFCFLLKMRKCFSFIIIIRCKNYEDSNRERMSNKRHFRIDHGYSFFCAIWLNNRRSNFLKFSQKNSRSSLVCSYGNVDTGMLETIVIIRE